MNPKVGITLLVALFFPILGLLYLNLFYFPRETLPLAARLPNIGLLKANPTVRPVPTPAFFFASPVRDRDLATIPKTTQPQTHLVFFLPDGAPIYSLFSGKISRVVPANPPQTPFENFFLETPYNRYVASYLVQGEVLVKEGQWVDQAALVAKARKTETGVPCLGGGNLGIYLFEGDKQVVLNKEMLRPLGN